MTRAVGGPAGESRHRGAREGGGSGRDGNARDPRGNGSEGVDGKGQQVRAAVGGAPEGFVAGENGEAMEVDTGEEGDDAFAQENGGEGQAGSGVGGAPAVAASAVAAAVNGDGGLRRYEDTLITRGEEIPEGDVAVLNNHHSEVRPLYFGVSLSCVPLGWWVCISRKRVVCG